MRFYIILLIGICSFAACKKKDLSNNSLRLVKIDVADGSNDPTLLEYDGSGRLIKIRNASGIGEKLADIGYNGNEILVNRPPRWQNAPELNVARLQLDAQGRLIHRNSEHVTDFLSSPFGLERHFEYDTTDYTYNSAGILVSYAGSRKDSISFWPMAGVFEKNRDKIIYSATLDYANGNLQSITRNFQVESFSDDGASRFTIRSSAIEKIVFSYGNNFPNRFDFKNRVVFSELGIFPFQQNLINAGVSNFPSKATTTRTLMNGNGSVISTEILYENPTLEFNKNRYLAASKENEFSKRIVYTYTGL